MLIVGIVFGIISIIIGILLFSLFFYYNLIKGEVMKSLELRKNIDEFLEKKLPEIVNHFKQGTACKMLVLPAKIQYKTDAKRSVWMELGYYLWAYDIFIGKVPMIKLMVFCNLVMWIIK